MSLTVRRRCLPPAPPALRPPRPRRAWKPLSSSGNGCANSTWLRANAQRPGARKSTCGDAAQLTCAIASSRP
eukprot:11168055-Alexandrium_andersonii.AAC.1